MGFNLPILNRIRRSGGTPTPIVYQPFVPDGSTGLITADSLTFLVRE